MKRFYLLVLLFFVSLPVLAKNKISMVTYFPVPYVAYSQVNTTEQMDIGLTTTCDMKLGCSEESATLNVTQVNVKGGKLNLDGGRGIKGNTLSLGNGNGEGKISFQNVRIQTGNMESVNAADIKAVNLNLFGKAFPSCKSANSESGGQMQWASLKLKGASLSELYLACGGLGKSAGCSNTPSKLTESRTCPSGTGTQTRTWNETSCTWGEWSGTCTKICLQYNLKCSGFILDGENLPKEPNNYPSLENTCAYLKKDPTYLQFNFGSANFTEVKSILEQRGYSFDLKGCVPGQECNQPLSNSSFLIEGEVWIATCYAEDHYLKYIVVAPEINAIQKAASEACPASSMPRCEVGTDVQW